MQECDYARVLSDAMRKKQPHIVEQFLGCANLPKELDLVSCQRTPAIIVKLPQACMHRLCITVVVSLFSPTEQLLVLAWSCCQFGCQQFTLRVKHPGHTSHPFVTSSHA